MSEKRKFVLLDDAVRSRAAAYCRIAPAGQVVRFADPVRKAEQNDKLHAMIDDIARQVPFMGRMEDAECWKRLLVDAFVRVMREQAKAQGRPDPFPGQARVVPSLDGGGVVQLGVQTRAFSVALAGEFIEFLSAYAAQNNVGLG